MNAPDRTAFLAARKSGLGGSDLSAILGINPYRSAVEVYLEKRGEAAPDEDSEAAYWGRTLEDVVAIEYTVRTGKRVQRINAAIRHPKHEWLFGNIDRAIVTPGSRARLDAGGILRGADRVLECKTASAYMDADWRGDDGSDSLPVYYAAQGMAYLAVTGLEVCEFACLIGGQRYVHRAVERDDETIRGILEQAEVFWFHNVVAGNPPEPKSAADVVKLYPRDAGDFVEIGENTDALVAFNEYRALHAQLKDIETRDESASDALKMLIGPHSGIAIDGNPALTWKAAKDSLVIDWEAAAHELARLYDEARAGQATPAEDVIASHSATKPGSRRFLLRKGFK